MAGSFIGLDIGTSQMKVAECRKGPRGIEVTALAVAPTPAEAYENSVIVDPQALGQAVKALLKQAGVGSRSCISSVSGQSAVVVRVIDVPPMNPSELAETMKWEVERHVPFAVSEVIMDYKLIERPEGYAEGQNLEVLMAVAQQDMIDRHVEMLFAAGIKPIAIDVEPLAVGRTLLELGRNGGSPAGHTVAIINIGATNTDIAIFRDKLLSFPRTLPLAGDNLTRAIQDAFNCDQQTAEGYKRQYGEVLMDQLAQPQGGWASTGGSPAPAGGFLDFSQPSAPDFSVPQTSSPAPPTASPAPAVEPPRAGSSPSGRMPFDFSAPGDAPAAPTDLAAGAPAPLAPAADLTGAPVGAQAAPADPGFSAPGFMAPPATSSNLPATVPGADGSMRVQVFNAMAPVLTELVAEIRRSMDYYRNRTPDSQVHEILLTGGSANLRNLAAFLESELGVPASVADALRGVQVVSKNYTVDQMHELSTVFPVSIGLASTELIAPPAPAQKKSKSK